MKCKVFDNNKVLNICNYIILVLNVFVERLLFILFFFVWFVVVIINKYLILGCRLWILCDILLEFVIILYFVYIILCL